jgi:hypothetical protein
MKHMLKHDPIPWLLWQEGEAAVRARRSLGLEREGDAEAVGGIVRRAARSQRTDGSFSHSPMKTAGVVCLLADLATESSAGVVAEAGEFLFGVLKAQPGYDKAKCLRRGELTEPWDLGGFFGEASPLTPAEGAQEANFYREYEPLLGPKSPVRWRRRSSFDRAGPPSCHLWGLVPLAYIIEALCRGGFHADPRLRPAVNVLLAVQRPSGGWCRNPGGGFECTLPAIRAFGAHPKLRRGTSAEAGLRVLRASQCSPHSRSRSRWRGCNLFAALHAAACFDSPVAKEIIVAGLSVAAQRQRRNGTFGTPCPVERVAAVVVASRRLA